MAPRADAIYLVLSEPYWEVLNHAPVRPLDYTYLKALPPTAQRFYEIVSYKIFAALQHRAPCATLRYADYCLLAMQHRGMVLEQVQKHMYKVHQPHLASGYLDKVRYDATTDADGQPDWLLHYTPGPRAHTEYTIFKPQPGADRTGSLVPPSDADPDDLGATLSRALPAPSPSPQPHRPVREPGQPRGIGRRRHARPRIPRRSPALPRSHRPRRRACRTTARPAHPGAGPGGAFHQRFMAVPRARRIPKNWRTPCSS